jgi:AraC-like DNA-binding protein
MNRLYSVKFPQISNENGNNSFISFHSIPFAKHNIITKTTGNQIGFLTEHTIFFILQGKKFFHIGNNTITVDSNEIILLKRGIYSISEFIPEGGRFEALMIFIPDKILKALAFENFKSNNATNVRDPYAIVKCNSLLSDFKSQYLTYFISNFAQKEELLLLKIKELFLLLCAVAEKPVLEFLGSCFSKEPTDIAYIMREHLLQPLTLTDFAKLSMRSLASFKRDFERQFNTSPKQWLNQQRIVHANSLLKSTNRHVADIAFECGFESVSHFIKIFKHEFGFTPGSIRAKNTIN